MAIAGIKERAISVGLGRSNEHAKTVDIISKYFAFEIGFCSPGALIRAESDECGGMGWGRAEYVLTLQPAGLDLRPEAFGIEESL